jgi:uncharacterized protein (DUF2344 family)
MKKLWVIVLLVATCVAVQAADQPVEFKFQGIDQAKKATIYSIKIISEKPVKQVDVNLKFIDKDGKVIMETPSIWQNIVKSTKQPIKKGETYVVDDVLLDNTAKAEATLLRVWFQDGTRWEAPK